VLTLLLAEDLRLHYATERGVVRAVDGVTLSLDRGEALAIVGESGCGKTSLGLGLMRLLPRNTALFSGRIVLDGVEVSKLSSEEFRRTVRWRKISMVFQGSMHSLNPVLRVGYQVAEPLLAGGGVEPSEARRRAMGVMRMVGLPQEVYDRYPHELSGGMKQRVAIAMALVLDPLLVILDEPTSALDVSIQAQIVRLLRRLKVERGLSMIFITHDIGLASYLCDRMGVMYAGEIVELGPTRDVLASPAHPYTQKLLGSAPRLGTPLPPEFIPGSPPDLVHPPPGCRFHPRCPYTFEACSRISPAALPIGPGHRARCHLHAEA
jgi:peptide/nickel transport system ATP-binding protein